jgi:hypothetical protein
MARIGLCGGSYPSQSPNLDGERTVNLIPEVAESPNAKSVMGMFNVPGKKVFCKLGNLPVRAELNINGRMFAVAGTGFYEVFADKSFTPRNALIPISNDGNPASLAASNLQVLIVSGGRAYYFTLATNAFAEIDTTSGNVIPGPVSFAGYSDGFGVLLCKNAPNAQRFQLSTLLDFSAWTALDFGSVSVYPDDVIAMKIDHRELWFFSSKAIVPYYNSGNASFPFSPVLSGYNETGCGAPYAISKLDNSLFWIQADERGNGMAMRAQGYLPIRVSNHGVEFVWNSYPNKVSDAVSYAYQEVGHTFWVIYFPSANNGAGATWVYDAATGLWHERKSTRNQQQGANLGWCHTYAFNKHLVGSQYDGTIYDCSVLYPDEAGTAIQWERISGPIVNEASPVFFEELIFDIETGLEGQPPVYDGQGKPRPYQMTIARSDDGGHTWSQETILSLGLPGEFKKRVRKSREGMSRNRVYKLRGSDPFPRITDMYVTGPDLPKQPRLSHKLRQGA